MRKIVIVAFFTLILLFGCSENRQAIMDQNTAALARLEAAGNIGMSALADTTEMLPEQPIDPRTVYNTSGGSGVNTDILTMDNPEAYLNNDFLDLFLSHSVEEILLAQAEPARLEFWSSVDSLKRDIARAASMRYLALVRAIYITPIEQPGDSLFTGARAKFEIVLIDIEQEKVLLRTFVKAKPDAKVDYVYENEDERYSRENAFIRSSLWENSRENILAALAEATGGRFLLQ